MTGTTAHPDSLTHIGDRQRLIEQLELPAARDERDRLDVKADDLRRYIEANSGRTFQAGRRGRDLAENDLSDERLELAGLHAKIVTADEKIRGLKVEVSNLRLAARGEQPPSTPAPKPAGSRTLVYEFVEDVKLSTRDLSVRVLCLKGERVECTMVEVMQPDLYYARDNQNAELIPTGHYAVIDSDSDLSNGDLSSCISSRRIVEVSPSQG